MMKSLPGVAAVAVALLLTPAPSSAQGAAQTPAKGVAQAPARGAASAPEPGVLWEHTVSMEMAGFSMPPQTSKICKPKANWNEPPSAGQGGEDCKVTDVQRSGSRMTWKVVCSGKEKMSGEGEMAWSGPTYTGKMTLHSADGDMRMNMKGRDLGEACDAGETRRTADAYRAQAEQAQKQAAEGQAAYAAAMKKACDDAVRDMQVMSFTVMQTCKDRKADFCARMVTRSGYIALLKNNSPDYVKDGTRACGKDVKDLEALKPQFCAETAQVLAAPGVLRDNSKRPDVAYLAGNCPAEAQVLAQRECAGMSYTGMEPGMAEYCVKYARKTKEAAPRPEAQPASPQDAARKAADDPAKKASDDAKKAVKGLFGF